VAAPTVNYMDQLMVMDLNTDKKEKKTNRPTKQ
jgi:hypothetical protein